MTVIAQLMNAKIDGRAATPGAFLPELLEGARPPMASRAMNTAAVVANIRMGLTRRLPPPTGEAA